jgi:hypothetical protein
VKKEVVEAGKSSEAQPDDTAARLATPVTQQSLTSIMRAGFYNISATVGIGVKSSTGPSGFRVCCIFTLVANERIVTAH